MPGTAPRRRQRSATPAPPSDRQLETGHGDALIQSTQGKTMRKRKLIEGAMAALLGAGSLMAHDDDDSDHGRDRDAQVRGPRRPRSASRKCRRSRPRPRAASARSSTPRRTRSPGSSATTRSRARCTQSHVHFGQMSVNGGDQLLPVQQPGQRPAPARRPARPDRPKSAGVITPEQVIGPGRPGHIEAGCLRRDRGGHPTTAWPMPTSTRPSGRAAKSAASCINTGP